MILMVSKRRVTYAWWIYVVFYCQINNTQTARANEAARQNITPPLRHCSVYSDVKDNKHKILELQCYAKCQMTQTKLAYTADMLGCRKACELSAMKSPRAGQCPNSMPLSTASMQSPHTNACVDACSYDFDCPDVHKCCIVTYPTAIATATAATSTSGCHGTRTTCVEPLGLHEDDQLPSIPKILKYRLPRGNKVEIAIESSANMTYFYHVETRYHIGLKFSRRKLSNWEWQPVEKIAEATNSRAKRIDISFKLKAGRWYQVRVAAVNAYGFRGYSIPSQPFTLNSLPKPPKPPADLKVIKSHFDGMFHTIRIAWCASKSNLPIEKYKITWSLYVKTKEESIISNESYVKDRHQYDIGKLLPESSYYIQVQAISISGNRRLKSEKLSILHNTTLRAGIVHTPLRCGHQICRQIYDDTSYRVTNHSGTHVETMENKANPPIYKAYYRYSHKFGIIAHITGFYAHREKVYQICPMDLPCQLHGYAAIRAKKDALEFSHLKYNTTYELKSFKTNHIDETNETNGGEFTFTTPKCESFRNRFPKMQIKCL